MQKLLVVGCLLLLLCSNVLPANVHASTLEVEEILLWPDGAPGASANEEKDKPTLTIYKPVEQLRTGAAVVVCPGGGYQKIAIDHEGHQVGEWFNAYGIAAFILKYRKAPEYHHPAPMQDVSRAIRYVRANADQYLIDTDKIGVMGFSAGGHLASTASTHFDQGQANSKDPIARVSSRPDFSILIYPVISFTTEYTHTGSRRNLLGDEPDPELVKQFSSELQVTSETPPTFLIHTSADTGVPSENSVLYYLALRKAGVPAEMHIFEQGRHGFGLAPNDPYLNQWPDLCIAWLRVRGVIPQP